MFNLILPVMSDYGAAFTAALSIMDNFLAPATCQEDTITAVEKEQDRSKALADFAAPIEVFLQCVVEAGGMSWQRLARDLYLERYGNQSPHDHKGQMSLLYGFEPIYLGC